MINFWIKIIRLNLGSNLGSNLHSNKFNFDEFYIEIGKTSPHLLDFHITKFPIRWLPWLFRLTRLDLIRFGFLLTSTSGFPIVRNGKKFRQRWKWFRSQSDERSLRFLKLFYYLQFLDSLEWIVKVYRYLLFCFSSV